MSPRARWIILGSGLLLIGLAVVFLAYAYWPGSQVQVSATLAPTLFYPPP